MYGSEDNLINIKGIEGYKMLLPEKDFRWLKVKMIMMMNLKIQVQIVHLVYILLYIYDIWKRNISYLTQETDHR